jgi:hypothetical protein
MIRSAGKAKELGYPHEPWTTRLLAMRVNMAQGTLRKILN